MDIQEWVNRYVHIEAVSVTVTEVVGASPIRQYKITVDGTIDTTPISYNYITTKNENRNDLSDSTSRETRYAQLLLQAEVQKLVADEVNTQITILEPDPGP